MENISYFGTFEQIPASTTNLLLSHEWCPVSIFGYTRKNKIFTAEMTWPKEHLSAVSLGKACVARIVAIVDTVVYSATSGPLSQYLK